MANAPKGKRGTTRTAVKKPAATRARQQKSRKAAQALAKPVGDSGSGPWSPQAPGVWIERDPRTGQAVSIAHPGQPWIAGDSNALSDNELRDIGTGYILAVNEVLQLPTQWLDDLARKDDPGPAAYQLRWKPFGSDPRDSFRCTRRNANGKVLDETAVLLACLARVLPAEKQLLFLNGGQGLRVTMHIDRAPANKPHRVRVTSVTTSLPPWTDDDVAHALTASAEAAATFNPADPQFAATTLGSLITALNALFQFAFGMPGSTFKDFGLRFTAPPGAATPRPDYFDLLAKSAPPVTDLDSLSYKVVLGLRMGTTIGAKAKDMVPLLTHAAAPPQKVFVVDPVTRTGIRGRSQVQPHLPAAALNGKRDLVPLDGVTAGVGAGRFLLADGTHVDVVRSFVAGDAAPVVDTSVEFDSATPFSSRTNTQAAVNTYYHFKSLVRRLERYGFIAKDYLSFADMPLKVKYRGGIIPGARGGGTINAQVRWRIRPDDTSTGIGTLETSLALADLRLSPRRTPLGIACDPRWLWHEFGHVLLAGATGELEFRFAHSAGDAMGAILHDPESKLVDVPAWRGITFPWVSLPDRHHDRRPEDGWSWSGTFNGRERDFATNVSDRRGYWTEQLLSSSLFRMYRVLGGDTRKVTGGQRVADKAARRAAADHALFLIIKAMRLLGPASVTPAMSPEDFVTALLNADAGTTALAPAPTPGTNPRLGGLGQKVIRWAFEQQGAFPDPAQPFPNNGPGLPPNVDIYINSGPAAARNGGYEPVDFLDDAWHARPDALWVQRNSPGLGIDEAPLKNQNNFVHVRVHNRGQKDAVDVKVEVFIAKATAGVPHWPSAAKWTALIAAAGTDVGDVAPYNGATVFGPFTWKPTPGTYALFATATCADDRANTDPAPGFASAKAPVPPQPLDLRVACDNNLGLRIVVV